MTKEFDGGVSRRALIIGMTNTDQVGMQQARAPAARSVPSDAEVIPDAGDGADDMGGGDVHPDTGLSSEDHAAFEAMRAGGDDAGANAGEDVDADSEVDNEAAAAEAGAGDGGEAAPARRAEGEAQLEVAPGAGQNPPKTISWGRFQRELDKARKAAAAEATAPLQEQLTRAQQDQIRLTERVRIINEALSTQPPQPQPGAQDQNAPPANPFEEADIDPTEDYAAAVQQLQRRQRYQNESFNTVQEETAADRESREMRDTFVRDAEAFSRTDEGAHWNEAYQHLKDSRITQICLGEFGKDPNDPNEVFSQAEVDRMVEIFNAEERWLVGKAIANKKSPAKAVYAMARTLGWKPPEAAAPAPAPRAAAPAAARPGAPAARAPAAPAPRQPPSARATLDELAAAVEAGRSPSDGAGAPPASALTVESLLAMDDDEFGDLIDNLPRQLQVLMGRDPHA